MKKSLIAAAFLGFLMCCISFDSAYAGLTFNNKTNSNVWVAVAYPSGSIWKSKGWWKISPNGSATVIGGNLSKKCYYYYAYDADGREWAGNYTFCTKSAAFTISGDKNCRGRGYDQKGFKELNVGNSSDYTLKLTGGSSPPSAAGSGNHTPPYKKYTYGICFKNESSNWDGHLMWSCRGNNCKDTWLKPGEHFCLYNNRGNIKIRYYSGYYPNNGRWRNEDWNMHRLHGQPASASEFGMVTFYNIGKIGTNTK